MDHLAAHAAATWLLGSLVAPLAFLRVANFSFIIWRCSLLLLCARSFAIYTPSMSKTCVAAGLWPCGLAPWFRGLLDDDDTHTV